MGLQVETKSRDFGYEQSRSALADHDGAASLRTDASVTSPKTQLRTMLNSRPRVAQLQRFQEMANRGPHARGLAQLRERFLGGNPAIVQRQVNLDWFNSELAKKEGDPSLSRESLGRLKEIQQVLSDPRAVFQALQALEKRASAFEGLKPTEALNLALQEVENTWMDPGRIKVSGSNEISYQKPKRQRGKSEVEPPTKQLPQGGLPPESFVENALLPVRALKDVGAGAQHGEYAHRLQWYIIHYYLDKKFNKERSERDSQSELRHLYLLLSNPKRVLPHPLGLKDGEDPVNISLWDAVLDARGGWTAGKHGGKPVEGLKDVYGGVGFAAPALLTAILTNREEQGKTQSPLVLKDYDTYLNTLEGGLEKSEWPKNFPTISKAVTDRKLKRLVKK